MKAELDKLDINKLINVATGLNNAKTKGDDLVVDKLKTIPANLKKLNDLVSNEFVQKTVYNKFDAKVNNLGNKINGLVTTTVLNTKIDEAENNIPEIRGLVTTTFLNTKIDEVDSKILGVSGLIKKRTIILKY